MKKLLVAISLVGAFSLSFIGLESVVAPQKVEASYYKGYYYSPAYTKQIQRSLNNFKRKYPSGYVSYGWLAEDGQYGSLTGQAVSQFQYAFRGQLSQDGLCGPKTWAILKNYYY